MPVALPLDVAAFPPSDTVRMLRHHMAHPISYNEVVLSTTRWGQPQTIEAFVVARGGDHARACGMLRRLRRAYPHAAGVVPLVSYAASDREEPFREETCE